MRSWSLTCIISGVLPFTLNTMITLLKVNETCSDVYTCHFKMSHIKRTWETLKYTSYICLYSLSVQATCRLTAAQPIVWTLHAQFGNGSKWRSTSVFRTTTAAAHCNRWADHTCGRPARPLLTPVRPIGCRINVTAGSRALAVLFGGDRNNHQRHIKRWSLKTENAGTLKWHISPVISEQPPKATESRCVRTHVISPARPGSHWVFASPQKTQYYRYYYYNVMAVTHTKGILDERQLYSSET